VGEVSHGTLDRRAVVAELVTDRGGLLCVTGLGSPSYDLFAAGDHAGNFYLWGAMGGAAPMGLGLALAQPDRPVLVVTGDGEMLMGIGALATIGQKRPRNLTLAVLDNGHYGETGMQASHTGRGVDLAAVARGCGIEVASTVTDMSAVTALRQSVHRRVACTFAVIRIAAGELPRALPPRDSVHIKNRFRAGLGYGTI
jgi:thiamine pyrophosphate-dependent acetolactate synthase large subunit-like protein